jgi:hypothetical protein
MYQPTLGRFLSRDPLAGSGVDVLTDTGFYSDRLAAMSADPWFYGGNWDNPYVYAANNPVRFVDPSGFNSQSAGAGCPCAGCSPSAYTKYIEQFLAAVKSTWIANICGHYVGTDTCQRWVFALEDKIPNFGLGSPCVRSAGVVTFRRKSRLSPAHVAYRIEMCNGAVFYADNGAWGGDDHIFFPFEIPPTATPV